LSYGKKDKKKNIGSSSSPNLGGNKYNWYHKYSPGTTASHIWMQWIELKLLKDRDGAKTAAAFDEVTNTVSSNSFHKIFETGASSYKSPDRICLESF
jgi:hypothetical protein